MTDEQLAMAKRLVAHSSWRWKAGMRITGELGQPPNRPRIYGRILWANSGEPSMVEWHNHPAAKKTWTMETARMVGLKPDFEDYATAAILLRMAMEADPSLRAQRPADESEAGYGWALSEDLKCTYEDLGMEAAEALLDAWGDDAG